MGASNGGKVGTGVVQGLVLKLGYESVYGLVMKLGHELVVLWETL